MMKRFSLWLRWGLWHCGFCPTCKFYGVCTDDLLWEEERA